MNVWLNGAIVPEDEAHFAITDHGALVGDGVIETFLARRGVVRDLDAHFARLRDSCEWMGIDLPDGDGELRDAIAQLSEAAGSATLRMRITVTSGEGPAGLMRGAGRRTLLITAVPHTPNDRPLTAVTLPWRRNEYSPTAGLKTLSMAENVLALTYAGPADEGIWLNTRGDLCEGTISNVFLDFGDRIVTPPLSSGCLPGVARAGVLRAARNGGVPIAEEKLDGAELDRVRAGEVGMFLTSAVRGIAVVAELDGHEVRHGELTARLIAAFSA